MLQQQWNRYAYYYYYCVATLNHNRARLTIVNLRHSSKKGIKFCHQNIRVLYGKIDEVREILLSHNFDIFTLLETSMSEDFHNAFFRYPRVQFHQTWSKEWSRWRCRIIHYRWNRFCEKTRSWEWRNWIPLVGNTVKKYGTFHFWNHYKPLDSSKYLPKKFNFFLSKTLQSIDSEKRESIVMGDMNVNYLIKIDHEVTKDIFTDDGFEQILNTHACYWSNLLINWLNFC